MQEELLNRVLRDRAIDIEARAIVALGSATDAWEWLKEPRQEFNGLSARELMRAEEGLETVESAIVRLEALRDRYRRQLSAKSQAS